MEPQGVVLIGNVNSFTRPSRYLIFHDTVPFSSSLQHSDFVAERGEVRIAPDVDRMLWACLHARVALPTEIGLDVVGPAVSRIDVHDVGRADIHALSAAVASGHVNEGGHAHYLMP